MAIQLVIFDIAGTIIHDWGEVSEAFVEALGRHGLAIGEDDVLEWKGAGKRTVIRHLLGSAGRNGDVEAIYADFVAALHERYEGGALQAIEGAEDMLAQLRRRGMKLAVTTGFGVSTMELILGRLGWEKWFPVQVSTEQVRNGRPAPDMIFEAMRLSGVADASAIANVGDTPLDLKSGVAAGVGVNIGVLSGMHSRERLEREPHTHLLKDVTELSFMLRDK